jgi:DNA-binding transcriptional ArsR family regulator
MTHWSFLSNYGLVLAYIGRYPDSTGREIAQAVGITERAVRMIVADLRASGYVEPEKVGRRNRYRINEDQPLRLLGKQAVTVGDLLGVFWREQDQPSQPLGASASASDPTAGPSGSPGETPSGQRTY